MSLSGKTMFISGASRGIGLAIAKRVAADTKAYPWISVVGIDPFTKAEQVRQPPTSIPNMLDVRIPRDDMSPQLANMSAELARLRGAKKS